MNPKRLDRCQQRVYCQTPVIGGWRRRRAIRALMRDGSSEAIRWVAEAVVHSQDETIRERATGALRQLTDPVAIDVVCAAWARSRHPRLARLLVECGWVAGAPPSVRALTALHTGRMDGLLETEPEMVNPLVEACWDVDAELAHRARAGLFQLKTPGSIDALCARWVEKREDLVVKAIEQADYLAQNPVSVRVLVALLRNRGELVASGGPEVVEALLQACVDLDPLIARRARMALSQLTRPETQDALCRRLIESDLPVVPELVIAAGYAPRDPTERAVYYFLTEQWEKCDGLDFDQRLLVAAYERGSRKLRSRIAEKARRAGRTEWIEVIVGGQQNRHVHEMAEEEWEAVAMVLEESRRWPEMWRLAQAAPADWSARLLHRIQAADWKPEADHERAGFANLLALADRCREEPPFLGRLMRCAAPLRGHSGAVSCLAIAGDGRHLVSGGNDCTVRLWSLPEATAVATMRGHTDWISCLAISPDERTLASGSHDHSIRLWSYPEGAPVATLSGHADSIRCLRFTPDGQFLFTGSDDGSVRGWRVPSGEPVHVWRGHSDIVSCLAVSPDGRVLASGSYDNQVRLWNIQEGAALAILQGHKAMVNCLAFSPDGSALVSGSKDRSLLVWRLPVGTRLARLKGHSDDVSCLALSSDGSILASGSWDTTVRLWSFPGGEPLSTLGAMGTMEGHGGWVTDLAFSPDGRVLASGGLDNAVRLWSVPGGAPLRTFTEHQERVSCLTFTPDGRTLISGSWDQTVRVWKSELARLRRLPLSRTTLDDLEWVEQALFNSRLAAAERAWLEFLQTMMQWRRRFDVQIGEPERIPVGEFDIEIAG